MGATVVTPALAAAGKALVPGAVGRLRVAAKPGGLIGPVPGGGRGCRLLRARALARARADAAKIVAEARAEIQKDLAAATAQADAEISAKASQSSAPSDWLAGKKLSVSSPSDQIT